LSIVPGGPPIAWIGATLWLLAEDRFGWAVFMALYGFFVISSIDNVVKPLLISRGAALPLLLVLLGVFGGIVAFGFIGLFLGPVLLAIGFALVRSWAAGGVEPPPEAKRE
ncbi:MAG: AI-2E family transporter, partial [Burkholderiales bacterium]|nr:AI-2E family transporter [Burkholderiales bacterium]